MCVYVRVSLDSHIEGTPVYLVGNTRERGADRLRRRYSLAEAVKSGIKRGWVSGDPNEPSDLFADRTAR